jgi:hypothetical protein
MLRLLQLHELLHRQCRKQQRLHRQLLLGKPKSRKRQRQQLPLLLLLKAWQAAAA